MLGQSVMWTFLLLIAFLTLSALAIDYEKDLQNSFFNHKPFPDLLIPVNQSDQGQLDPMRLGTPPRENWTVSDDWDTEFETVISDMVKENRLKLRVLWFLVVEYIKDLGKRKKPDEINGDIEKMVEMITRTFKHFGVAPLMATELKGIVRTVFEVVAAYFIGYPGLDQGCWLPHYVRMDGRLPNYCEPPRELSLRACHKPCPPLYKGFGHLCYTVDCNLSQIFKLRNESLPPTCPPQKKHKAAGLCYREECSPGYEQKGPLCLVRKCPDYAPFACGRLCLISGKECANQVFEAAARGYEFVHNLIQLRPGGAIDAAGRFLVQTLRYRKCPPVSTFQIFSTGFETKREAFEIDF